MCTFADDGFLSLQNAPTQNQVEGSLQSELMSVHTSSPQTPPTEHIAQPPSTVDTTALKEEPMPIEVHGADPHSAATSLGTPTGTVTGVHLSTVTCLHLHFETTTVMLQFRHGFSIFSLPGLKGSLSIQSFVECYGQPKPEKK